MEAPHIPRCVPGERLEGRGGEGGDPHVLQVGTVREFLSQPALLPVKQEPDEGLQQHWETQWQLLLKAVASSHSGRGSPHLPESSGRGSAKGDVQPHFNGAIDADRQPRGQCVPQSLLGLSGEAQEACGRLNLSPEKVKEEILEEDYVALDIWRQRFRRLCYEEAEGPRHTFRHLQKLCHQWLKPERHSKEQVLQLVILEQFLAVLPQEMQCWVRDREPQSCTQAVSLAEDYLRKPQEMEAQEQQALVPLEVVVVNSFKTAPVKMEPSMETMQDSDEEAGVLEHKFKQPEAGKREYKCSQCGKVFLWRSHLTRHERTHMGEKLYNCMICEKSFGQASHLAIHERTHTGEKPYKCTVCGKIFNQSSVLLRHMMNHTGERGHKCSQCGKSFRWKSHLIRHMPTHTGEKLYKCSWCDKTFKQLSHLPKHERIHTGEKPFSCATCGKRFIARSDLVVHERIHSGKKPYACSCCGRCFSNTSALSKHKRTHTGEKPYKCSHCTKSFSDASTLIRHRRIHTGEKPYKCPVCGKSFSDSSELTKHKRNHAEERSYKCSICGKGFGESYHLIRHERNHTGDKPYSCLACGKSFIDKSSCSKHDRTHTG